MYTWERSTQRFRGAGGRFVRGDQIEYAFRRAQESVRRSLESYAEGVLSGSLSLSRFQSLAGTRIKEGHILAVTLARGGVEQMDEAARLSASVYVRQQYAALRTFVAEVEAEEWPLTRLRQRIVLYAVSMWTTYNNERRASARDAGLTEERSILHPTDRTCEACREQADRGWVPLGDLVPIGERTCLMNCRCSLDVR